MGVHAFQCSTLKVYSSFFGGEHLYDTGKQPKIFQMKIHILTNHFSLPQAVLLVTAIVFRCAQYGVQKLICKLCFMLLIMLAL